MSLREAMLYNKKPDKRVQCNLCSHRCRIDPGAFGVCRVRENIEGMLSTHSYGACIARHCDPVEKKPFYHVLPGSYSYSIATVGCNFRCDFCQNWQISQIRGKKPAAGRRERQVTPREIVTEAIEAGCSSIAYTYTEPTIFFEYAYETARLAHERGLRNLFVTNGYMTAEALETISPYLDACNVDLKSFRDEFYRKQCGARLEPVLESIRNMRTRGIWVEITTLIIPGHNDSQTELDDIARFIAELDPTIPWHISRFHPNYKMTDADFTPRTTLQQARDIAAQRGLFYVYIGNVADTIPTRCPQCGIVLLRRSGFTTKVEHLQNGQCGSCGTAIHGLW